MNSVQLEKLGGYRLILVLVAIVLLASVSWGQSLSGWGTATIDGVLEFGGPGGEPLSPAAIASLKAEVEARVADATLKAKDAKLLLRSLEDALERINQGKLKQAEDEIEKFLKEVKKLVKKGDLNSVLGDQWTSAANNIISPPPGGGEWANAGTATFALDLPGGAVNATLYVMNDASNIYAAFIFPHGGFSGEFDVFRLEFGNGDIIVTDNFSNFLDASAAPFSCGPPSEVICFLPDAEQNGEGVFVNSGGVSVFEMSHPLTSSDPQDIALSTGGVIGYRLGFVRLFLGTFETWYPGETDWGTITILGGPSTLLAEGSQERIGKLAEAELASEFTLGPNYPNPFNPRTTIAYEIQTPSDVSLKVFNMLGQEVATLVDRYQSAGKYSVSFEANNLPSGLYVYQLRAGSKISNRTMVLVK